MSSSNNTSEIQQKIAKSKVIESARWEKHTTWLSSVPLATASFRATSLTTKWPEPFGSSKAYHNMDPFFVRRLPPAPRPEAATSGCHTLVCCRNAFDNQRYQHKLFHKQRDTLIASSESNIHHMDKQLQTSAKIPMDCALLKRRSSKAWNTAPSRWTNLGAKRKEEAPLTSQKKGHLVPPKKHAARLDLWCHWCQVHAVFWTKRRGIFGLNEVRAPVFAALKGQPGANSLPPISNSFFAGCFQIPLASTLQQCYRSPSHLLSASEV